MVKLDDIFSDPAAPGETHLKLHQRMVIYHFEESDVVAQAIVRLLLNEEKPSVDLGKGRSILFHTAHVPTGEEHLHFRVKGKNIAAINKSGTAHDKSHGVKLQRWALDGMEQHYPDFKRPVDGVVECLMGKPTAGGIQTLNEDFTPEEMLLSKAIRFLAEQAAADG